MTQRQPPGEENPFGWEGPGLPSGGRPDDARRPTTPGQAGAASVAPASRESAAAGTSAAAARTPADAARPTADAARTPAASGTTDAARTTGDPEPRRARLGDPTERRRQAARRRFIGLATIVAGVLAIGGLLLGIALNPFAPEPATLEAATPTTGIGAPGFVSGGRLAAGQCFATYTSAWQDEFELADCGGPHAAELYAVVSAAEFADGPTYPGEDALRAEAMRACQAPSSIDVAAASEIEDLRIEATYALSQAEWDAGARSYWCFASRASGESLETALAPL